MTKHTKIIAMTPGPNALSHLVYRGLKDVIEHHHGEYVRIMPITDFDEHTLDRHASAVIMCGELWGQAPHVNWDSDDIPIMRLGISAPRGISPRTAGETLAEMAGARDIRPVVTAPGMAPATAARGTICEVAPCPSMMAPMEVCPFEEDDSSLKSEGVMLYRAPSGPPRLRHEAGFLEEAMERFEAGWEVLPIDARSAFDLLVKFPEAMRRRPGQMCGVFDPDISDGMWDWYEEFRSPQASGLPGMLRFPNLKVTQIGMDEPCATLEHARAVSSGPGQAWKAWSDIVTSSPWKDVFES